MNLDAVRIARTYIGTPFHHLGRKPGVGLDCVGLLVCVARELGLVHTDFDTQAYAPVPDGKDLLKTCEGYLNRISRSDMTSGDVLVMITDVFPQHMGIIGDYSHGMFSLIHASNSISPPRVIESRLMFSRAQRFAAAYSFLEPV